MPGDVGAVATLLNTVASWLMTEDGYAEWKKRRQLAALHDKAKAALDRHDWAALRDATAELKRLSERP